MQPTSNHKLSRRSLVLGISSLAVSGLLAACGDDDDDTEDNQGAAELEPTQPKSTPVPGTSTPLPTEPEPEPTPTATETGPEIGPDGHFESIEVASDGTRHLIPLDDILSGGPPKDGIPSIDVPRFATSDTWDEQDFDESQFVLGIEVNGIRRAYPFQVLVWHELVNDTIEDIPVLASYCPLCGSAIAFVREIEVDETPRIVEFGVSGKLYNSDLLMYDRMTDTYWSQLTGTAVVGPLTGQRLEVYPSELMTWGDWKVTYPESEVLTRETGFNRDYDNPPYAGYDESPSIWFPVAATDDRLHEKARVTGVELSPFSFAAYPDELVAEHGPVNDEVRGEALLVLADPDAGDNVVVFRRELDGTSLNFELRDGLLVDQETGSAWGYDGVSTDGEMAGRSLESINTIKGFWFAWYAFHQETALWLPDEE